MDTNQQGKPQKLILEETRSVSCSGGMRACRKQLEEDH